MQNSTVSSAQAKPHYRITVEYDQTARGKKKGTFRAFGRGYDGKYINKLGMTPEDVRAFIDEWHGKKGQIAFGAMGPVAPCRCNAYDFPHRPGSGRCKRPDTCSSGYPAGKCHEECGCGWDDPHCEETLSPWARNPDFRQW